MLSDDCDLEQKTLSLNNPVYLNICDNVEKIKNFYTDLLGLRETAYSENNFIEYVKDGKTIMFYQNDKAFSRIPETKRDNKKFNWCIKGDSDLFLRVFKILNKRPQLNENEGYLSLDISDPMDNKVIIYLESEKALKKA
ncbi:MAG: hypothetical protein U0354_10505 [Candidatus Sericytochromatia bacterium]